MLKMIPNSRIVHYLGLLIPILSLCAAAGANLNCLGTPSSKTVPSSSVREPEMRSPQGGLLLDRSNSEPAHVEFSKQVTLADGTVVPVTAWRTGRKYWWSEVSFDDPANPNVATIGRGSYQPDVESVFFVLDYEDPTTGKTKTLHYRLRVHSPPLE